MYRSQALYLLFFLCQCLIRRTLSIAGFCQPRWAPWPPLVEVRLEAQWLVKVLAVLFRHLALESRPASPATFAAGSTARPRSASISRAVRQLGCLLNLKSRLPSVAGCRRLPQASAWRAGYRPAAARLLVALRHPRAAEGGEVRQQQTCTRSTPRLLPYFVKGRSCPAPTAAGASCQSGWQCTTAAAPPSRPREPWASACQAAEACPRQAAAASTGTGTRRTTPPTATAMASMRPLRGRRCGLLLRRLLHPLAQV